MRDTTFTELRNHAHAFFNLVETVRVLRKGKPIAEIHPVASQVPSWKRRAARPLQISGEQISRVVLDQR